MYNDGYGYDYNHYKYDRYGYDADNYYPEPKKDDVNIQKIKCINSNINVNGIEITEIPEDSTTANELQGNEEEGANTQNSNEWPDLLNIEKNLVNVCLNVNLNEQIDVADDGQPIPTNLDLAVANFFVDDLSIRLGNGDGTFTSTAPDVAVGNSPISVVVGLFNADSNLDLAVANFIDNDVSIRLGNVDGTFTSTAPDVAVGNLAGPRSVAVGEFDNS